MERDIPISCMRMKQLFYLDHNTSEFEKYMEEFDWGMETNFNALPYDNTKAVIDEDPTDILHLDLKDKVFEAYFNWFIDNETVLQGKKYY